MCNVPTYFLLEYILKLNSLLLSYILLAKGKGVGFLAYMMLWCN